MVESKNKKPGIVAYLIKAYECRHSVRFNASDEDSKNILLSIYISNKTFERLGRPDKIMVEIGLSHKSI